MMGRIGKYSFLNLERLPVTMVQIQDGVLQEVVNNYYDHYSKQGPLYIMVNKKDQADKYQFHFESNQYMDKEDRNVNLPTFLNERPELKEFFKEMFKTFLDKDKKQGKRVQVRYPGDAVSKYIGIYGFEEFMNSLPQDMERFDFESGGGYRGDDEKLPTRPLPEKFTTFSNLKILHIEGLLNEIPDTISNLKNLKFLSLAKKSRYNFITRLISGPRNT